MEQIVSLQRENSRLKCEVTDLREHIREINTRFGIVALGDPIGGKTFQFRLEEEDNGQRVSNDDACDVRQPVIPQVRSLD